MSEKRFELGYIQSTWWKITDTQTGNVIEHNERKVTDLLNFQNTQIKILQEENEQLKLKLKKYEDAEFERTQARGW